MSSPTASNSRYLDYATLAEFEQLAFTKEHALA